MSVGPLVLVLLMGVCALLALLPPPRSRKLGWATFFLTGVINEQPFVALTVVLVAALLAGRQAGGTGAAGWTLGLAAVDAALLVLIAVRATRARPTLTAALAEALATEARGGLPGSPTAPPHRLHPALFLVPYPRLPGDVEGIADIRYGPTNGRAHLLDLYRPRRLARGAPVLIHWHGGAFRSGAKSREALALLHRLAARGWVCISPNYHLSGEAPYPANQVDAKRVIAWVREHGGRYGADPSKVIVAGGSAGGHIASLCGLTQNDPRFQPGFEGADTSVSAVVSLYGYYGPYDWKNVDGWEPRDPSTPGALPPTAPLECDARLAPPFLVVHGQHDGIVPAWTARSFVRTLRACSRQPVIYAELPGARHAFDALPSLRTDAVIEAVERFATWAVRVGAPEDERSPERASRPLDELHVA